jgi:hypothetical protein
VVPGLCPGAGGPRPTEEHPAIAYRRTREAIWLGRQRGMFDVDEPQRSFASAEEAVQAFIAALRNHREAELRAILRPGPTASSTLATDIRSRAELDVRPDDWPLPIPLIEEGGTGC